MCEPATIAGVSLALGAVSTGLAVKGTMNQAQAQKDALKYQSEISGQNEQLALAAQDRARVAGGRQRDDLDKQIAQLVSLQRTGLASAGVDLSSGSPLQLQTDTRAAGRLDQLALDEDIERRVYQLGLDAQSASQQGQMFQASAENISPQTRGFSTFLGGASRFAEQAYTYRQPLSDLFSSTPASGTSGTPINYYKPSPTTRSAGSLQGSYL